MLKLKDGSYVYDYSECPNDAEFINYSFKKQKYGRENPALRIYFSNDIDHNIKIIKDLIHFKKKNISFCSEIDGRNVRYIVSNYYSDDVLKAFEALYITDKRERVVFLYNTVFNQLDEIWANINPCGFCNNVCVGNVHRQSPKKVNGCCYSFDYPKHQLFSLNFIENIRVCKYFNEKTKKCLTQNMSCKLFVCPYLRRTSSFNTRLEDFLLVQSFFSKKQKLILKYNFFRSKDEIIDKLLAKNCIPYFIYYWFSYYRISKSKK